MSHGHQDIDTAPRIPPAPRFRHRAMTRQRAYDVAIAFGRATDMPITPKLTPDGRSYDALIPMGYIEGLLESLELLEPA